MRIRAWILALVACSTAVTPLSSSATVPISYADQVGYAWATVSGSYSFNLSCQSVSGEILDHMTANGSSDSLGWLPADVFVDARDSHTGHVVQVGGQKIVSDPDREETYSRSPTDHFGLNGSTSQPSGNYVAHMAWAVWGANVDCVAKFNGVASSIAWLDGKQAFYAGPEAFSVGAYYQDGSDQVSVGRIFTRQLSGGPVFGAFNAGIGQGFVATDNPYPLGPIDRCHDGGCMFGRPKATNLVVGLVAGMQTYSADQGELWCIDIPASSSPNV